MNNVDSYKSPSVVNKYIFPKNFKVIEDYLSRDMGLNPTKLPFPRKVKRVNRNSVLNSINHVIHNSSYEPNFRGIPSNLDKVSIL